MRIGRPAHEHGIAGTDIQHAVRNPVRRSTVEEDLTVLIGPAKDGGLLEIDGDDPVAIHAMVLRRKFYEFLG